MVNRRVKRTRKTKKQSPAYDILYIILSIICPGLGHLVQGKPFSGIVWFIGTLLFYFFYFPVGAIFHFLCVITSSPRVNRALTIF